MSQTSTSFLYRCWDPNSGSLSFIANTLLTEPAPSPPGPSTQALTSSIDPLQMLHLSWLCPEAGSHSLSWKSYSALLPHTSFSLLWSWQPLTHASFPEQAKEGEESPQEVRQDSRKPPSDRCSLSIWDRWGLPNSTADTQCQCQNSQRYSASEQGSPCKRIQETPL